MEEGYPSAEKQLAYSTAPADWAISGGLPRLNTQVLADQQELKFIGSMQRLDSIGCLNIHGTHVTALNSTHNNVFLFVSNLK